jgi:hypothetical protein
MEPKGTSMIPTDRIEQSILLVRGHRVILDFDLARLYGVETRSLVQAVKRNRDRFPVDFVFQLSAVEYEVCLKSQIVISNTGRGGRRTLPYAFTEHGAIMAANVLNSVRAVKASLYVVRAFVNLRHVFAAHKELAAKLAELERRLEKHDGQLIALVDAIRQLMQPPPDPPRRRIGFATELEGKVRRLGR